MLAQRDRVERQLENLLDDVDQDGNPLGPRRDIESTYEDLGSQVDNFNRAMFTEYVKFLTVTLPPTPEQLAGTLANVDQRLRPNPGIMKAVDSSPAAPRTEVSNVNLKSQTVLRTRIYLKQYANAC